jgi:hypothetical protein
MHHATSASSALAIVSTADDCGAPRMTAEVCLQTTKSFARMQRREKSSHRHGAFYASAVSLAV